VNHPHALSGVQKPRPLVAGNVALALPARVIGVRGAVVKAVPIGDLDSAKDSESMQDAEEEEVQENEDSASASPAFSPVDCRDGHGASTTPPGSPVAPSTTVSIQDVH
jgi:hypothetical protein